MTAVLCCPTSSLPQANDTELPQFLNFHSDSAAERLVADLRFSQTLVPPLARVSYGSRDAKGVASYARRIAYQTLLRDQVEFVVGVDLLVNNSKRIKKSPFTEGKQSNVLTSVQLSSETKPEPHSPSASPAVPSLPRGHPIAITKAVPQAVSKLKTPNSTLNSTTVTSRSLIGLNDPTLNDPDDPASPLLQPAHPKLYLEPSQRRRSPISLDGPLPPSGPRPKKRSKKRSGRDTVQPSQGDAVLISFLAPDQHEISRNAGLQPLTYPSESESTENEMEGGDGADGDGNGRKSASRQPSESGEGSKENGSGATSGSNGSGNEAPAGGSGVSSGGSSGGSGDGGDDKEKKQPPDAPTDMEIDSVENTEEKEKLGENGFDKKEENGAAPKTGPAETAGNGILADDVDSMDVVQTSSSSEETAASLMSLAGGAVSSLQTYSGFTATNARNPDSSGPPASPETSKKDTSTKNPPLPSMISQSSSPSSLPPGNPGNDGKNITLPSLDSMGMLADLATKEQSYGRRASNSQTIHPNIVSHATITATRPSQSGPTPLSPGLPSPAAGAGGFSPDGSQRPPMHHLTAQQRQYYLNLEPGSYYPNHPHQHYQSPYPPIKDAAQSNAQVGYPAGFQPGRELPGLAHPTSPNSANFFAQSGSIPAGLAGGRRESTSSDFQFSDHTTPSGSNTGDTLTAGEESAASPRNRMPNTQAAALSGGGFKCDHPGCKAPPFQTQYLLNSHANVHSSNRPHYCPVKGCPRAEGGKGFKRKNEMIRHGLVHDSPGYICPFCPDREHKYPRPDNLQRHVRVHHMDKDKDDPQLRDVLSQRPEGGNRGRRRRLGA